VGVGTRVAAGLYERLMALDVRKIDIDARVRTLVPWHEYERHLHARFGRLADSVVPHARQAYPSPDQLRHRLTELVGHWPALQARLRPSLRPAAAVLADLRSAGAPTTFAELGVSRERARRAVVESKDIRARYTVLHLCWELGVLEEWADQVLPEVY
jgi:glycerol-1-phosphate dehydrogenase [NAD(P)+]